MKKILSIILAMAFVFSMSVTAIAADEKIPHDDSALNFYEAQQKGILYDKPLYQKSREELL